jgi:hypothetical protein
MVESFIVWNCTELIIVVRIKIHNFKHSIKQYHCKSILESPYKIQAVLQENCSKADGLVMLKLDETHVLLNANRDKVAVLDGLLVNSFYRDNLFTMVRYSGVNVVHVVDGNKDDAPLVAAHSKQLYFLEFFL